MKHATRAASTPDNPPCSPPNATTNTADQQATALDGVYRTSFTREELAESPLLKDAGEINDQNWGDLTLTFDRGRVTFTQRNDLDRSSTSGTYTMDGKAITLASPRRQRWGDLRRPLESLSGRAHLRAGRRAPDTYVPRRGVGLIERDSRPEDGSLRPAALDTQPPL